MNVVSVHRAAAVSGVSAAGARAARLPRTPWRPLIIGPDITPAQVAASPLADAPGLDVLSWPAGTPAVQQVRLVRDALRRLNAHVVVPNDLLQAFAAAGLDHARGLRCAAWLHSDSHEGEELFTRGGELADAWRGVSTGAIARAQRVARELGLTLPPAREPLHACVEVQREPAPMPPEGAALRLAYLGRLEKNHKRVLDLAALADALAARGGPFELRVAGEGPAAGELRTRLAPHLAAGRAVLAGALAPEAARALLEWSHLLVLVSASEGMPTAVMEAMAAGRGVAITRTCGDASRVVREGVEGVLAGLGAMDDLAEQAAALWRERGRLARMGRAAHLAALVRFAPAACESAYDEFVREAADAPRRFGADAAGQQAHWLRVLEAIEGVGPTTHDERAALAAEWCEYLRSLGLRRRGPDGGPGDLPSEPPRRESPAERRLRRAVERLLASGVARVALYGAGAHTRKVERVLAATPQIVAVLDDRAGTAGGPPGAIAGRPVVLPESLDATGAQAVVISSDEHEREMAPRAAAFAQGRPVVTLYDAA